MVMVMRTSKATLDKIAEFEGIRLKAYKPVAAEKYWTIGVGHYGPDVTEGMTITRQQAMDLFDKDIKKFEGYVTSTGLTLNQAQFDALVSFTYNCGPGNLAKLIKGRNSQQIADAMLLYNKGSGKVLPGLTRRRKWERELFLSDSTAASQPDPSAQRNPYPVPTQLLRRGSTGVGVRWLQRELVSHGYHLLVDGIYGPKTEQAVRDFQQAAGLKCDGLVGPLTRNALQKCL